MKRALESAWEARRFETSNALRVFHGPGEGAGWLEKVAIEIFGDYAWVIVWGEVSEQQKKDLVEFLVSRPNWKCRGIAAVTRPEKGVPAPAQNWFGDLPVAGVVVDEFGAKYSIRFVETRQAGLFLDHAPLRAWLREHARGRRVLNTFAYTGSLSVACGLGGAQLVTTLDLAKNAMDWARDNWKLNSLSEEGAKWIQGDALEWMPKWIKRAEKYDLVILDPPSFSRGNKGSFSTEKDFKKLCDFGMNLLARGGILVASMNSAKIGQSKVETDLADLASEAGELWQVMGRIDLPETFPTRADRPADRYLKGVILKKSG